MSWGGWTGTAKGTETMVGAGVAGMGLQLKERQVALEEQRTKALDVQRLMHAEAYKQEAEMRKQVLAEHKDKTTRIDVTSTLNQMGITRTELQQKLIKDAAPFIETGEVSGLPVIQKQHAPTVLEKWGKDTLKQMEFTDLKGKLAKRDLDAMAQEEADPEFAKTIKEKDATARETKKAELTAELNFADNTMARLKERWAKETGAVDKKETWGAPEEMTVGGTKFLGQKSTHGKIEPIVKDKSTTTVIKPEKEPKEPSGAEMERLRKAVKDAGEDPSAPDITMVNKMAAPLGLEFKKVDKEEKGFFGGTKTVGKWDLVQKQEVQPPAGFKDTGKTSNGKKVYQKGNKAWVAPL